jgi:hypothetical protein
MSLDTAIARITQRRADHLHAVAQMKARAERYARLHRDFTTDAMRAMDLGRED